MSQTTLLRSRLADHPLWSRALAASSLAGRLIQPVIVSARVEDRERVPDAPWLERVSITELVRDARSAAGAGLAGLWMLGHSDRKDEVALIASERDHVVVRAIRAVKDAAPDLAIATDVCVCAYTPHGQCVLFSGGGADVVGTHERLAEIALVHAEAGADLLVPSGMLEGTVAALRRAMTAAGHADISIATMVRLESVLYQKERVAMDAMPVNDRAVPLIPADDRQAAISRATRDVAAGADAVVIAPGIVALDVVARAAQAVDRPVISFFTADERAFYAGNEQLPEPLAAEREALLAARHAGAELIVSYGAWSVIRE